MIELFEDCKGGFLKDSCNINHGWIFALFSTIVSNLRKDDDDQDDNLQNIAQLTSLAENLIALVTKYVLMCPFIFCSESFVVRILLSIMADMSNQEIIIYSKPKDINSTDPPELIKYVVQPTCMQSIGSESFLRWFLLLPALAISSRP